MLFILIENQTYMPQNGYTIDHIAVFHIFLVVYYAHAYVAPPAAPAAAPVNKQNTI